MKIDAQKKIIAVALTILFWVVCALTLALLAIPRLFAPRTDFPDFTRFPNPEALQSYLESELTLENTTRTELQQFLIAQSMMERCFESADYIPLPQLSPSDTPRHADMSISCTVLAPPDESLVKQLVTTYFYSIRFLLYEDTLIGIIIVKNEISL